MSSTRLGQAEHHLLRVRTVIDIASLLGAEAFDEVVPEDFEDFLETAARSVHVSAQGLRDALEKVQKDSDFMGMYTGEYNGILMQVGTPVRKYFGGDAPDYMCSYRWGHQYVGWVYGMTYDDAWAAAMDWAAQRNADDLAKAPKGVAA
jgi:hypothetical protein